jgi:ubiquitin carboxyl-terminal hydrolase 9/24
MMHLLFVDREETLTEWDYMPPVGPRPAHGFVGLKNAGATCYMNSVIQQLYMVESIRVGLLAAEGAATDLTEDFSGEERNEVEVCCSTKSHDFFFMWFHMSLFRLELESYTGMW